MSEPLNNVASAFPNQPRDAQGNPCMAADPGLTKREYMAAKFCAALLANPACPLDKTQTVRNAVHVADMLIEELRK